MTKIALRDLVDVAGGGTPRKSVTGYYGGGIPWVTPKDMKRPLIGESEVTLTDDGVRNSPAKLVPEGSVLVVVRSGVLKHTLPVALTTRPVTVNQDMKALTPHGDLDPSYLARMLKALQPTVLSWVRATTADNFPIASLLDFEFELPPLPEQRRIAAILDHADALRAKRRQVLAHLDSLHPAVFNEVLASAAFPSKSLAEVADIWDCPHSTPKWTTSGSICLRTPNLTRGGWNWEDTRYVDETQFKTRSKGGGAQAGDIVLSREGTVGIAAIVQPGMEVCMGQRLVQVRPDPDALHPQWALEYLLTALRPDRISAIMVGSTAQHLNVKDLRALTIPMPKMSIQREFAERATAISSALESVERARAADDGLFASLQSRAFRGEL